jgi:hypothetical protein
MGRLQRLLQGGRHVADIGVLYPIATLQAGYYFGPGKPYEGGVIPPEADYMDIGDLLALQVRRDFTFVHPEVLEEKCRVEGKELLLENPVNYERFRVFIIPGSRTISLKTLQKIKDFYDRGGKVLATTRLPDTAAELGGDHSVRQMVAAIFGGLPDVGPAGFTKRQNGQGGKAYFVPRPTAKILKDLLNDALPLADVEFEGDLSVRGGNLSYIHKVLEGRDLYFLANSSEGAIDIPLCLRGHQKLEWWDPHNGTISPAACSLEVRKGELATRVRLHLGPVRSVFLVGAKR